MKENIEALMRHYGTQEAWAVAWDVTPSAVSQWVSDGRIPPMRLVAVEQLTEGAFTAEIINGEIVINSTLRQE